MAKKSPNFIQIHTLTPMNNVLVNRDDSGMAKRTTIGGHSRIRISSQCRKYHWRDHRGKYDMYSITDDCESIRSRLTLREKILPEIKGDYDEEIVKIVAEIFMGVIYTSKEGKEPQLIMLGIQEINYLKEQVVEVAKEVAKGLKDVPNDKKAKTIKTLGGKLIKEQKKNLAAMREQCKMPGGIAGAAFGRMITADKRANIDSAVQVSHSFTVHAEESETDYFSAMDDLMGDGVLWDNNDDKIESSSGGAGHVNETEITSNLFYGHIVINVDTLLENTNGDREIAAEYARRQIHLACEVHPSAKAGSTAPYARSSFAMVSAGDTQPQSYGDAFRNPCAPQLDAAIEALETEVLNYDTAYDIDDKRKYMTISNRGINIDAERTSVPKLADWVSDLIKGEVEA